jgi:hypothetical protein
VTYTFDSTPNSYFEGRDLRVTRARDGRTVIVNRKEGYWGLNIKSEWIRSQRSPAVQTAADNLPDGILSGLEVRTKDFFWREITHLAGTHGFNGYVYQEGRSGGWACVDETRSLKSSSPVEPTGKEKETVARWLNFCFDADELRETAEAYFDDRILEANQNLQVELSDYADWVGADVRTLDGPVLPVRQLDILQGRPIFRFGDNGFAFANETTLVRKADGSVPTRLTADPIMEEVFQIIEARGDVTSEQLNDWLDADEDHDPSELYIEHVAPAVDAIEDAIKAAAGE